LILLLNKNIKIILNYVLGPLVFLFLFYSIYHQIRTQTDWRKSLDDIAKAFTGLSAWRLYGTVALMLVNWGLETWKWKLAIRRLEPVPFSTAFKAVLTGVTIGSFTPNRMGEYLGRMLYLDEGKRLSSVSLTIVCSMAQLLITLAGGCLGLVYLLRFLPGAAADQQDWEAVMNYLLAGTLIALPLLLLLYFRLSSLVRTLFQKGLGKYMDIVKILKEMELGTLLGILFLSFARYLVFMLQYFLMFRAFGVDLSWPQAFSGVSVMFLTIAIVPSFTFLSDIALRWASSIRIIRIFSPNSTGIFAVSLGIWLINLIIPALIGSLLILRIKLFRKR
jgi:hypothetical protein